MGKQGKEQVGDLGQEGGREPIILDKINNVTLFVKYLFGGKFGHSG